tara:strand:- start:10059 stop:10229 length:171 start_codon:yes stop_codon:yes gene_type:complete
MMTNMKDTQEPIAFQLVSPYGMVYAAYPTWEEADHEATSLFWSKGKDYKIVEVFAS